MGLFSSVSILVTLFTLILVALGILVLVFEVWMFIDALKNQKLSPEERILWLIGMLLIHPIVAIVYYFIRRRALLS